MKGIKKLSIIVMFTIIGAIGITGCSSNKKNAEANKSKEIILGYYNCDHMTAAPVAVDAGIYKKMGLNVKAVGNGKVPEAMAAGQMDAGYIGTAGLVGAISKGSPIVVVSNNHLGGSEYLVVSKDIKKPSDLLGQKIAANPSEGFLWKTDYSPQTGLPADSSKYNVVNIASNKDAYLALKTGKIKAFTTCDPWGSQAEYDGVGRIIADTQYKNRVSGKMYNCCSFSLNKNFIKEYPDLAKKMVKAHSEAIEYIYTHPIKAAKIFSKNYNVNFDVALMTIYKKTVGEGRTLTWKIVGDEYKNNLEMYKKYKVVDKVPKYDEVINTKILSESGADDFDKFIKEKVDPVFPLKMKFEDWKSKAEEIDGK